MLHLEREKVKKGFLKSANFEKNRTSNKNLSLTEGGKFYAIKGGSSTTFTSVTNVTQFIITDSSKIL